MTDLTLREKIIILQKHLTEPPTPVKTIADGINRHPSIIYRFLDKYSKTGEI